MAQIISFSRPKERCGSAEADSAQANESRLPNIQQDVAKVLAAAGLWDSNIGNLIGQLDLLEKLLGVLDESDVKCALRDLLAANRQVLVLAGQALESQYKVLSSFQADEEASHLRPTSARSL
jgi:hypothetical protein